MYSTLISNIERSQAAGNSSSKVVGRVAVNAMSCTRLDRLALHKGEGEGEGCCRRMVSVGLEPLTFPPALCSDAAGNPLSLRRGEAERTIQIAAKSRMLSK